MAKNKHAHSEQTPAAHDTGSRPVEVDRETYGEVIEVLQRLHSLLTYIGTNGVVALSALSEDQQDDIWALVLSLTFDAERMLENGSVK